MKIPVLYQIEKAFKKVFRRKSRLKTKIKTIEIVQAQNKSFQENFGKSKKMIVFVNFGNNDFCGGVMTMFHFANLSRQMKHIHGCDVLHATSFTNTGIYHLKQSRFKNDETIYRITQIMDHAKNLETLIMHVPELMMGKFSEVLTSHYKKVLKEIPNLQINVLNQNIEAFPPVKIWKRLREITNNITQTTAFDKYTTQEVCDKYELPLYRLIGYNGLHKNYKKTELLEKEKLFIYSLDLHEDKERILNILKEGLPDFKFQQIQNLTFDEFMKTAQSAMFSLTFGEGFDGYFTTIYFVGGLGFTVYNEQFFPTKKFLEFPTVYKSYDELARNIVKDVRYYLGNPEIYKELSRKVELLNIETAYNEQLTYDLLEKFYKKEPTFMPSKKASGK